jgi:Flp pilus assembly protein TadG
MTCPDVDRRFEHDQDDQGVAAVEFSLILPLLVILLFVIVNSGLIYLNQLQLQSTARNAARIASVDPTQACSSAMNELSTKNIGNPQCALVENCSSKTAQIQLSAFQQISIPFLGERSVHLHANSTFVCAP